MIGLVIGAALALAVVAWVLAPILRRAERDAGPAPTAAADASPPSP